MMRLFWITLIVAVGAWIVFQPRIEHGCEKPGAASVMWRGAC